MPSYKGHLVGGAFTYIITYQGLSLFMPPSSNIESHLFFLGITLIGALFPDIDVYSKIQQLFFKICFLLLIIAFLKHNLPLIIGLGTLSTAIMAIQHRGITHRWWFLALLSAGIYGFSVTYYPQFNKKLLSGSIFFFSGAVSHLVLDYAPRRLFRKKRRFK